MNKRLNISKLALEVICVIFLAWGIATTMLLNIERKENAGLQEALVVSYEVRDEAIQCMAEAVLDRDAMQNQICSFDEVKDYQYIGECELTAYCCEKYEHICGTGTGITASGLPVQPGLVAVDPSVIPLGSTVVINGVKYLAADTGGAVKGNHIDIAVETHQDAINFGVQSAHVWIIPKL